MMKPNGNGDAALEVRYLKTEALVPYPRNARLHGERQIERLMQSIRQFGFNNPVLLDGECGIIAGHARLEAAKRLEIDSVPTIELAHLSEAEKRAYIIADNHLSELATWDIEMLQTEVRALKELPGFEFNEQALGYEPMQIDYWAGKKNASRLGDRFIVPPFDVLDARGGVFLERSRQWKALGITSEIGRDDALIYTSGIEKVTNQSGTSIFNPVLCELAYRWFSPADGAVLDPFAGGSVRGLIAAYLGRRYFGVDLSAVQCAANKAQIKTVLGNRKHPVPVWHCGDSQRINEIYKGKQADLLFTCPPYFDLEVYSENKADLSNMSHAEFCKTYRGIIADCCALLKPDRFAVFVVGDVRDGKTKTLRGLPALTAEAFQAAGLKIINDAVILTPLGTLPLRAKGAFMKRRLMGRAHQRFMVFVKGNPVHAAAACEQIDVKTLDEMVQLPDA